MSLKGKQCENIENIAIDAGVVYLNYGLGTERLLGPCRGDNSFKVDQEFREIEANGLKGRTKGYRRKIREDAEISVNLMSTSLEDLRDALPGSKIQGNKLIADWGELDYIANVTIIQEAMNGYKKYQITNALADEEIEITLTEDDETVIAIKFAAHYDCPDTADLWSIEDLDDLGDFISVIPKAPGFTPGTGVINIPSVTGVVYKIGDTVLSSGNQTAIEKNTPVTVQAYPSAGYKFTKGFTNQWQFSWS